MGVGSGRSCEADAFPSFQPMDRVQVTKPMKSSAGDYSFVRYWNSVFLNSFEERFEEGSFSCSDCCNM